jgi:NADP-dependent 3-hydroxy acid dehydrogenase YdfG
MKNPRSILITGASSGLGAALARHYAQPGITLHLQGRNRERLEATAASCRVNKAMVYTQCIDVTDANAMAQWVLDADQKAPIDLVIANAGISAGTGIHGETGDQVRHIFATNIDGVINTLQPVIPLLTARQRGQIAVMSSLAGMRGLPSCPAYSASKACIRTYGEGLRGWLGTHGVEVSVICPGYIRTPMTEVNNFPMPFLMTADKAARVIAQRLRWNQSRIAFPLVLHLPLWLMSCLSPTLTDAFFARLPAKPAAPGPL